MNPDYVPQPIQEEEDQNMVDVSYTAFEAESLYKAIEFFIAHGRIAQGNQGLNSAFLKLQTAIRNQAGNLNIGGGINPQAIPTQNPLQSRQAGL